MGNNNSKVLTNAAPITKLMMFADYNLNLISVEIVGGGVNLGSSVTPQPFNRLLTD